MIDDFLSGKEEVQFPDYAAPNDWTFVEDAAKTILHCLTSPVPTVGAYNVSGDYRHVRDAVAHLQQRFAGTRVVPAAAELPPSAWEFQCDRLEREVGYRPRTSLEDGLDEMISARGGKGIRLEVSE
jgi:nucleoside-diphosphate-sugar epimerase